MINDVCVIPRELTDEEWREVKYNVDRKANPDIPLWRIQEAVKYAAFVAGHRGEQMIKDSIPADVRNFLGKVQGVCLGVAMSGRDHPNPDGVLMEPFNEAQEILFPTKG